MSYNYFGCVICGKNWIKKPARGYWAILKQWTCNDCKLEEGSRK